MDEMRHMIELRNTTGDVTPRKGMFGPTVGATAAGGGFELARLETWTRMIDGFASDAEKALVHAQESQEALCTDMEGVEVTSPTLEVGDNSVSDLRYRPAYSC